MKILLVEDDERIAAPLEAALHHQSCMSRCAENDGTGLADFSPKFD
ncbi:MAG: response regulator transcription factor [Synechococcales cyanobacterium RM1_1_8]|nr:response regulator transcription factor [Synechococcales cyanobacterium RM1_1_8]